MGLEIKDILQMLKNSEISEEEAEKLILKIKLKEEKPATGGFDEFESKIRVEFHNLVSDEKNVDADWETIFKKVEVKIKDVINEMFGKK
jgi:hypothetical protein